MNVRLAVAPREREGRGLAALVLAGSLLAGLAAICVVFAASGVDPFYALYRIFSGSFGSVYGLGETVTKAIPLILIGAGLAFVFRAKFWNIGAEGQLLAGATVATWIGLNVRLPGPLVIALMFVAGFAAGAAWGALLALLKARFGVNEVISSLMLNYIAYELITLLITGPWKGATQHGFPYTDDLSRAVSLTVLPTTRIHVVTLVLALASAAGLFLLLASSRLGYELRVLGENREAARYAGIDLLRVSALAMVLSGGVAGLAGVGEVAGIHHHLSYPTAISSGYGFTAILVAWLAKLNPLAAIASGFFYAGILVGGDAIQVSLGLPAATVQVFNGVLLVFLIGGDFFLHNRVRLVRAAGPAAGGAGDAGGGIGPRRRPVSDPIVVTVLDRALAAGTPLLLGTLGEIVAERSGILNLGVEGMMSVGAVTGFMTAVATGSPWLGLLAAVAAGAAVSLLHAFATVTLRANQVVSGLALAMLGVGLSGLLGKPYIGVAAADAKMAVVRVPGLADLPWIGRILFVKDPFFYLSIALGIVLWFLLAHTRWGVRVRSVGENPAAAEVQGVSVAGVRYLCTAVGGALAGMAGAHLSLAYSNSWSEGLTGGRGWIVIALTIFALWNPLRAFLGAFLFGGVFVLQYVLQPLGIPPNLLGALPYAATLLVLVLGGVRGDLRHLASPEALGESFARGEK